MANRIKHQGLGRRDALEFNRFANSLMASISRALEQSASDDEPLFQDNLQHLYIELQRIVFAYKSSAGRMETPTQFENSNEIGFRYLQIFRDEINAQHIRNIKIRVPKYKNAADFVYIHEDLWTGSTLTLGEVVDRLVDSFQSAHEGVPYFTRDFESDVRLQIDEVTKLIPSQKIAPAHFDIVNGKLTVVDQEAVEKPDSSDAISASLEALIEAKNELVSDLNLSNCDRRLTEQVERLGSILESGNNVVRLGLENINARIMATSYADELPNAIYAKLEGFSSGLAMYISQFADWQTFVQNAAEAAIEESAVATLPEAVVDLIGEIETVSSVVDESVPQTIRFLREMSVNPGINTRKATFALIRTIENLVITSFKYTLNTFQKTAEKTSEKFSEGASTVIARALIAIGLSGAYTLLPIAVRVQGLAWLQTTYQFIRDNIAPLANVF